MLRHDVTPDTSTVNHGHEQPDTDMTPVVLHAKGDTVEDCRAGSYEYMAT